MPFNDTRHLEAHQFLVDEAYLLDAQQYDAWLDTLTDDIRYVMPVRVTTARGAGFDTSGPGMAHFDEDKYSLSQRVARFATEHAWTEDPPSRLRHFVTNVRTFAGDDERAPVGAVGRAAVPQPRGRQRKRPGVLRPRGCVALVR